MDSVSVEDCREKAKEKGMKMQAEWLKRMAEGRLHLSLIATEGVLLLGRIEGRKRRVCCPDIHVGFAAPFALEPRNGFSRFRMLG